MMCYNYFILFFLFVNVQSVLGSDDLPVGNLLRMQQGNAWPTTVLVLEGQELLLKLTVSSPGQHTCFVTTPKFDRFDVDHPPSNRFERWSDVECGVRIKNVMKEDVGRWRLVSVGHDKEVVGWSEVTVEKDTIKDNPSPISILDGDINKQVDLTILPSSYCVVTQPFSQSSLIPGHCAVTLEKATRVVQGSWGVVLGLPGKIAELQYTKRVDVNSERLDFGYNYDSQKNKLNLYCNILHSEKNVTFCRFQKTNSATGFNVVEGLSDGRHSYYGDGFPSRQCGMSIEAPGTGDYGTWQCSVGVQQWAGAHIVTQPPMQALISVSRINQRIRQRKYADDGLRTIFVQKDLPFSLMCQADHSLKYCWFEHVNGSFYTPTPKAEEDQPFWYSGEGLQLGDCGITFSHATEEEEGLWLCHMGPMDQVGVEITDQLQVRVTGPLAASKQEIETHIGGTVTLYCHPANGKKPLEYCRFVSPTVLGLSIDETVTSENAIQDRYHFTEHRSLNAGDCSLTIKSVTSRDIGQWTCAAMIHEEPLEASDVVLVYIDESSRSYRAGIIGMSFGIAGLAVLLVGLVVYRRYLPSMKSIRSPFRTRGPRGSAGDISFNTIRSANTNASDSSSMSSVSVYPVRSNVTKD